MIAFSSVQESLQMHAHISQGNVFLDGRQYGHYNGPNYTFHNMLQGKTFERILPMPVRLHLTTMMCFFLSSCANSYIGDNTAHLWQRAYNVKNLCYCRQVRMGPYSCTWILTPKIRCIRHFISIFPILKGIHISWRIRKEHTLCSRWGNYEVVVDQQRNDM